MPKEPGMTRPTRHPALAALVFVMAAATAPAAHAQARSVTVNRVRLSDSRVAELEQQYRVRVQDGAYWYDRASGAWGRDGGPTAGWILPGLDLGGPLPADASRGNTGVFINGRELHLLDVAALMRFMPVYRGRWWVDAQGNFGAEGGPVLGNLWVLAQQRGMRAGKAWSVYSNDGNSLVGGDASGCSYFNSHDYGTGSSTSWASPGC
jgi:hypothetical protein